jgi:CheY-like chemotaxis protein
MSAVPMTHPAEMLPGPLPIETSGSNHQVRATVKARILVADDERLIAETLVEILNLSGFEAVAAYSGDAALQHLKTGCPDALIADVVMPGMNGIEVAKYVRRHCPATRVFLLSGQAATADLLERARRDGDDFELLAKPLDPDVLLRKLKQ